MLFSFCQYTFGSHYPNNQTASDKIFLYKKSKPNFNILKSRIIKEQENANTKFEKISLPHISKLCTKIQLTNSAVSY